MTYALRDFAFTLLRVKRLIASRISRKVAKPAGRKVARNTSGLGAFAFFFAPLRETFFQEKFNF